MGRRHHFHCGLVWDDPESRSGLRGPRGVRVLGGWRWPGVGRQTRYWAHPSGADSSIWSAGGSARQLGEGGAAGPPCPASGLAHTEQLSSPPPSFGDGRQQLWVDLRIDEPCSEQHLWFVKIAPLERRTTPHLKPQQGLGLAWTSVSPRLSPAHPELAGPSTAWAPVWSHCCPPRLPLGHPPAGLPPTVFMAALGWHTAGSAQGQHPL